MELLKKAVLKLLNITVLMISLEVVWKLFGNVLEIFRNFIGDMLVLY